MLKSTLYNAVMSHVGKRDKDTLRIQVCIFAPFTFVIFLIDAIKKVVSGDGNEYFPGLGAGLSLFIMLGGIFYVLL